MENPVDTMDTIRTLTVKDADKVTQLYFEEFVPDEPWFSSLGIFDANSILSKMTKNQWKKDVIQKAIKSGHSFGAFDEEENLLGIMLGKVLTKETAEKYVIVVHCFLAILIFKHGKLNLITECLLLNGFSGYLNP